MTPPTTMRALQLQGPGRLEEVRVPVPRPGAGEILIRTETAVICTTDLTDIGVENPEYPVPRVMGHEGAGHVAALGEGVQEFAVGDRVTAHPVMPCGHCRDCRRGLSHLCASMEHLGCDRDGTFADYFVARADRVRPVPPSMDIGVAALMEPVAVSLEALRRARLTAGERLLVVGDGPFGIMVARLARAARPSSTVLVGHHPFRLGQAPQAIPIDSGATADVQASIREAFGGIPADAAVLAAGTEEAVGIGLRALGARGRLVVFAVITEPVRVDLLQTMINELEILGSCNDEDLLDEALERLADPELGLGDLITHRIPFRDWRDAFELAAHGKERALKVALRFVDGLEPAARVSEKG